jgi:transposase InsO family protein
VSLQAFAGYYYVNAYVRTCKACQSIKNPRDKAKTRWGEIPARKPWGCLSIDLWGPLRKTKYHHNVYVLTVIDTYTKWALAIPIKNKTKEEVARKLVKKVFRPFGPPDQLHSDLGGEFINELLNEVCKLYEK